MNLEQLILDRAHKGELTHLSLWCDPRTKQWLASYTASQSYTVSRGVADDPVTAAVKAIEQVKTKRTATKVKHDTNPHEGGADDAGSAAEGEGAQAGSGEGAELVGSEL
jgi:hypothetical protein